jgi:hypothetical protein
MSERSAGPGLDVEQVLDALCDLIGRTESPIVRECLIDVRQDIAYLATPDGQPPHEADGEPEGVTKEAEAA